MLTALLLFLCFIPSGIVQSLSSNHTLLFKENPVHTFIDVIIPCTEKDLPTLDLCIKCIKKYGHNIRKVIVISAKRLTDEAEWFDEKKFPFSKFDLALEIFDGDQTAAEAYIQDPSSRIGWIYQQLLKLYSPFIVPHILPNVLVLDADTIFLKPVNFFDKEGNALYNTGIEYHKPYFKHMKRLLPSLHRVHEKHSGICHHMLFQRPILSQLFDQIKAYHQVEPWKAICKCIDHAALPGSAVSEYEIYFNFIMSHPKEVKVRPLMWANIDNLKLIVQLKQRGYHYVACHAYMRQSTPINTHKLFKLM